MGLNTSGCYTYFLTILVLPQKQAPSGGATILILLQKGACLGVKQMEMQPQLLSQKHYESETSKLSEFFQPRNEQL